jgi:hypothetical protein
VSTANPTVFDEIHFTGAFQHLEATKEEEEGHAAKKAFVSHTKRSKAEVSPTIQCSRDPALTG